MYISVCTYGKACGPMDSDLGDILQQVHEDQPLLHLQFVIISCKFLSCISITTENPERKCAGIIVQNYVTVYLVMDG